jgi:hypothetical protein
MIDFNKIGDIFLSCRRVFVRILIELPGQSYLGRPPKMPPVMSKS